MSKQEFIRQLRMYISSANDAAFINDTVAYYEDYIEKEIRHGKTEEQVLRELGDPRLIAKSILASYKSDSASSVISDEEEQPFFEKIHVKTMPAWAMKIIFVLVVFLFFAVIMLLLSWLMPIILLAVLGYFVYKLVMKLV